MNKKEIFALGGVLFLTACGGNGGETRENGRTDAAKDAVETPDMSGRWEIVNVVVDDSTYAMPQEIDPDRVQYMNFAEDNTFGINTNCNTIGGTYDQKGDSISFSNMLITEMACDNMDVEQLLMRVLPEVRMIDVTNDSIVRLNAGSPAYIVLKKTRL